MVSSNVAEFSYHRHVNMGGLGYVGNGNGCDPLLSVSDEAPSRYRGLRLLPDR